MIQLVKLCSGKWNRFRKIKEENVNKALLFYVIDEHTNLEKYCKIKRLIPYKTEIKMLDGKPFEQVIQYVKDGYLYDVLESNECYSGYMLTLVRKPSLSYEALLDVALSSRKYDERAGAIGIILKEYPEKFEKYITIILEDMDKKLRAKRNQVRMIRYINHVIKENTGYVWEHESLLALCQKIEQEYSAF